MQYSQNGRYEQWLSDPALDEEARGELRLLEGDPQAIADHFGKSLFVGMGGLNAKLGVGSAYLNARTFTPFARGAADYVCASGGGRVLLGSDGRESSPRLIRLLAQILAEHNLDVALIDGMVPAPVFSFAVRRNDCAFGFYVTAAHHSALSNGLIAYDAQGCLLLPEEMRKFDDLSQAYDPLETDATDHFDALLSDNKLSIESTDYYSAYIEALRAFYALPDEPQSDLSILFVTQTRAEAPCLKRLFEAFGFQNLSYSEAALGESFPMPYHRQGAFCPTACEAFKASSADILICTDSSLNNCSVAVKRDGRVVPLTGVEMCALLMIEKLRFLSSRGTLPRHPVAAVSLTASPILKHIAASCGVQVADTLIGFRNIVRVMEELDDAGRIDDFLIGCEDNGSLLVNAVTRDKDALSTALSLALIAAARKRDGDDLLGALAELNTNYGYFAYARDRYAFEGPTGSTRMYNLLRLMCHDIPTDIGGMRVRTLRDFERRSAIDVINFQTTSLPLSSAQIIALDLDEGSIVLRPAAVKPLLRVYISTFHRDPATADENLAKIRAAVRTWIAQRT